MQFFGGMSAHTRKMFSASSATRSFATIAKPSAFKIPRNNQFSIVNAVECPTHPEFKTMRFDLNYAVQVRFTQSTTLKFFEEKLRENTDSKIDDIKFFSLTGARVPLCEEVSTHYALPLLLQVNNDKVFALNFNDQVVSQDKGAAGWSIKDEEHYFDFGEGVGLRGYEKFLLPHFSHRLIHCLPDKQTFSSEELGQSLGTTLSYFQSQDFKSGDANYSHYVDQLVKEEYEYYKNEKKISQIIKQSERKATALCWLGSSVAIGQAAFILSGTFHYFSWDIMEPVSYLMMFGNFTFSYAFYLLAKRDLELTSIHSILVKRFTDKAAKRIGLDIDEHNKALDTIMETKKRLNFVYEIRD